MIQVKADHAKIEPERQLDLPLVANESNPKAIAITSALDWSRETDVGSRMVTTRRKERGPAPWLPRHEPFFDHLHGCIQVRRITHSAFKALNKVAAIVEPEENDSQDHNAELL